MARRMIIRHKNGNNITTERPARNRHFHVPKLRELSIRRPDYGNVHCTYQSMVHAQSGLRPRRSHS